MVFSHVAVRSKPPRPSSPLLSLRPARRVAGERRRLAGMAMMMTVIDRVAMAMIVGVGDMRADAERRVVEDFARRS